MKTVVEGERERQQAQASYPLLFEVAAARVGTRRLVVRAGTGLRIVVVEHRALAPAAVQALGEYRLQQYVLSGLYDSRLVERAQVTSDPSLVALAPQDCHIIVGDASDRVLCYACVQSPVPWTGSPTTGPTGGDGAVPSQSATAGAVASALGASLVLADINRPLFPVETEYGRIFGLRSALASLPLARVRELGRLVRNQVVRTPLDDIVVVETLVALARLVTDPTLQLAALLGCAGPEVRRLLYSLGVPVAYASNATICGENASGGGPTGPLLWADASHEPGRFWPFVIAPSDIAAEAPYFDALEEALCHPLHQIGHGLARLRRKGPQRPACYITASSPASGGLLWTGA